MNKRVLLVPVVVIAAVAAWLNPQWFEESESRLHTLYGNVDIREVQLGFRVPGRLQTMNFEEGDAVEAGDILAILDAKPLQDAVAIAEAGVLQAQARLLRVNTGSRPQEIQQAQARLEEAEAALANAVQELAREKELYASGLNSKRALDAATAQHDQAAARVAANKQALALAVEGFRSEDIAEAQAGLTAAKAQLEQVMTQLADTRLLAPSSGVIQTRVREAGAMLAVGSPVYTLSLTDTVYVRAYVGESQLGQVVPGAQVIVTTDSSSQRYQGQVGFVSPRAEFTPKTVETTELRTDLVYRLRIVVENPGEGLRQGMPVTVELAGKSG